MTVKLERQVATVQEQLQQRDAEVLQLHQQLAGARDELKEVQVELINSREDCKAYEEEDAKVGPERRLPRPARAPHRNAIAPLTRDLARPA